MRKMATWFIVGTLALGATAAWAQHTHEHDEDYERKGARHGQMMVPPGAYLPMSEETQALWQQVGALEAQLHEMTWEYSLMWAQGANEEAVEAKVDEMRAISEQLQALRTTVREHVVFPEGMFLGGGEEGERGRGGGQGGGGGGGQGRGQGGGVR